MRHDYIDKWQQSATNTWPELVQEEIKENGHPVRTHHRWGSTRECQERFNNRKWQHKCLMVSKAGSIPEGWMKGREAEHHVYWIRSLAYGHSRKGQKYGTLEKQSNCSRNVVVCFGLLPKRSSSASEVVIYCSNDDDDDDKVLSTRSTPCPNVKQGDEWNDPSKCENGDGCGYCHTRTEQQFHPEVSFISLCSACVSVFLLWVFAVKGVCVILGCHVIIISFLWQKSFGARCADVPFMACISSSVLKF